MPSQDQTSEGKFHEWSKSLVVKKTRLVFSKFLSSVFLWWVGFCYVTIWLDDVPTPTVSMKEL